MVTASSIYFNNPSFKTHFPQLWRDHETHINKAVINMKTSDDNRPNDDWLSAQGIAGFESRTEKSTFVKWHTDCSMSAIKVRHMYRISWLRYLSYTCVLHRYRINTLASQRL